MNLRRQLLLVSLLLLSLPWAGCQFIREMEGALRQGQEQALQATAGAVAAFLERETSLLYPAPARRFAGETARNEIYAFPTQSPVIVDGYGDGWEDIPTTRLPQIAGSTLSVEYQAQTGHGNLYLLLRVGDDDVVYENPGLSAEPNGDRLLLRMWHAGLATDYLIATVAPGSVRARAGSSPAGSSRTGGALPPDRDPARVKGYWQDAVGGYTLELELPLHYTGGRLGLFVFDASETASAAASAAASATASARPDAHPAGAGNIQPTDTAPPPWLLYRPAQLQQKLAPFSARGGRIQIVDQHNWLLADAAAHSDETATTSETFWLLRLLYRGILADRNLKPLPATRGTGRLHAAEIDRALAGTPSQRRYLDPRSGGRSILSAAAPIRDERGVSGAVIVRQSGETYLSLTDQAFSRLLGVSLLALGTAAIGLLAYASLLSWRIRNLSRAVGAAVAEDGRVTGTVTPSRARDEIGELSRRYADLLARLAEHNAYLRNLSRTLSHELRTPIAVIQSSLDNLEHAPGDSREQAVYLGRAREGLRRLQHILTAMSEASRLEESVHGQDPVPLDLVPLLRDVFAAYRSLYPEQQLELDMEADQAQVVGVAELIVQAMDKLMDNAAAFCPPQGHIRLRLRASAGYWCLELANEGPPLPSDATRQLFEPLVSLRKGGDEGVHLGLGLHIVRLIVEAHRGRVFARNLPDNEGVAVTIELPMAA